MKQFEKELNQLSRVLSRLEALLDKSEDSTITPAKVKRELLKSKEELGQIKDVAQHLMPQDVGKQALDIIDRANKIMSIVREKWDISDHAV